jgi:dTDP-4-dehydrorhamnose reductase
MRILVTGSNGLLGQKLCGLLQSMPEIELIATARNKLTAPLTGAKFALLDTTESLAVEKVISETHPEVVINTAAMTMVDKCELEKEACWNANVHAVENLIRACERQQARLLHLSTDFVFDGSHGPLDETAAPAPVNYYGLSKLEAEKKVMAANTSWCIVRTVLVYGVTADMSRSNIVLWVRDSLVKGQTIRVVNDQFRTPTLVEDLAMGCYLAAIRKAKDIYHISGFDFVTPYDIAIRTAEFFKLDKSLITPVDSATFTQPARRPLVTGFIIDKAKKELGYMPHSLDEGLKILSAQIGSRR